MANITITLTKDSGASKEYKATRVTARVLREAMVLMAKMETGEATELDMLDGMVAIAVSAFKHKDVTEDSIYDGIEAHELMPTLQGVIEGILFATGDDAVEGKTK